MTDYPQHYDLIDPVERFFCVYEQKPPILRSQIFVPNSLNPVDYAVNSRLKSGTQTVILTRHGGCWYCDL